MKLTRACQAATVSVGILLCAYAQSSGPHSLPVEFVLQEPDLAASYGSDGRLQAGQRSVAEALVQACNSPQPLQLRRALPWHFVAREAAPAAARRLKFVLRSEPGSRDKWYLDVFVTVTKESSEEEDNEITVPDKAVRKPGSQEEVPGIDELPEVVTGWFLDYYIRKPPRGKESLRDQIMRYVPVGLGKPLTDDPLCAGSDLAGELLLPFEDFSHLRQSEFLMYCRMSQAGSGLRWVTLNSLGTGRCGDHIRLLHTKRDDRPLPAMPSSTARSELAALQGGPVLLLEVKSLPPFLSNLP